MKQMDKGMLIELHAKNINANYADCFLREGRRVRKVVQMWPVIVVDVLWGRFLLLGDISAQYLLMAAHKDLT